MRDLDEVIELTKNEVSKPTNLTAIDINKPADIPITSQGTAYYRLDTHMKEFFEICQKKHGIIGFTWDSEDPWNFGIILDNNKND